LVGVFGGYDGSSYYPRDTLVYNHDTNTWTTKAPIPTARHVLAAAPLGPGLAGVFGGYGGEARNEAYDYNANVWSVRAPLPTGRYSLAAVELGSGVAGVFGGWVSGSGVSNVTEIYLY
jgi:hypothetical protein